MGEDQFCMRGTCSTVLQYSVPHSRLVNIRHRRADTRPEMYQMYLYTYLPNIDSRCAVYCVMIRRIVAQQTHGTRCGGC
jgi:hypothetical protein